MNVLVIHGPNLNILGKRNKNHYGRMTQDELFVHLTKKYEAIDFTFYQSNFEGDLVEIIQTAFEYDAVLINAAAYTHTSIAIRDALETLDNLKVEVHLSDVDNRESFRKINYISDVCHAKFSGKQEKSYEEAIEYIIKKLQTRI
ncbi:MAG TPA: 3-dehydroquinate dehydratase [Acholeplasma sp.]|jgi:3-dehydroquinate dehydratase-2|nr:3-dehydroquinate dehydratase [Acholeplasma sp.]